MGNDLCAEMRLLYSYLLTFNCSWSSCLYSLTSFLFLLPITAIQKHHVFHSGGPCDLLIGLHATDAMQTVRATLYVHQENPTPARASLCPQPTIPPSEPSLHVGEWVLVKYDDLVFPGEIKLVEGEEVKVTVMIPSGSRYFKWPTVEDAIFYKTENVIRKLHPPTLKSSRGTYEFSEKWWLRHWWHTMQNLHTI